MGYCVEIEIDWFPHNFLIYPLVKSSGQERDTPLPLYCHKAASLSGMAAFSYQDSLYLLGLRSALPLEPL